MANFLVCIFRTAGRYRFFMYFDIVKHLIFRSDF